MQDYKYSIKFKSGNHLAVQAIGLLQNRVKLSIHENSRSLTGLHYVSSINKCLLYRCSYLFPPGKEFLKWDVKWDILPSQILVKRSLLVLNGYFTTFFLILSISRLLKTFELAFLSSFLSSTLTVVEKLLDFAMIATQIPENSNRTFVIVIHLNNFDIFIQCKVRLLLQCTFKERCIIIWHI